MSIHASVQVEYHSELSAVMFVAAEVEREGVQNSTETLFTFLDGQSGMSCLLLLLLLFLLLTSCGS